MKLNKLIAHVILTMEVTQTSTTLKTQSKVICNVGLSSPYTKCNHCTFDPFPMFDYNAMLVNTWMIA
jgi:hypothetical protein